jgi:hypothetical protein
MRWRKLGGLCLAGLLGLAGLLFGDAVEEANSRLLRDVQYLASDELEGRGVGTQGLVTASHYIRDQFAAAGLNVHTVGEEPFQKFELVASAKLGMPNKLELCGPDGQCAELELNQDYGICSFGGTGAFDGEIVFCGYGIDAPDLKYDDFAGLDLNGKIALIMRRNPQQGQEKGPFAVGHGISRHAELRTKLHNAIRHDAAAVLFVNDPYADRNAAQERQANLEKADAQVIEAAEVLTAMDPKEAESEKWTAALTKLSAAVNRRKGLADAVAHPKTDPLMPFGYAGSGDAKGTTPAMHITQTQADRLLTSGIGKTLAQLEAAIDADLKPHSAVVTGWKARGVVTIDQVKTEVANVIATIEGEGPLADENVIIGAHYDHVGRGGAGSLARGSTDVHNGADDNASGTVALLELARRLAARPEKPARRLVFIAFTGEERGLLGSARYVREPVYPLEKTVAMFNMDMVGRLKEDKLVVFGSGTSSRWEPELKELNQDRHFELSFKPEGFGPSDHSSFYGKKIPVLHLFTGNHPDYHRPSDDWDKLNIEGIRRVVDLLEDIVLATANNPERPDYVEVKGSAQVERSGNRPYVGTIPDFGSDEPGYSISGAASGSPADKGGLQGGDRIVKFGDDKITGLDDFDLALRKHQPGETVAVEVIRAGKSVTLKIVLDPPR